MYYKSIKSIESLLTKLLDEEPVTYDYFGRVLDRHDQVKHLGFEIKYILDRMIDDEQSDDEKRRYDDYTECEDSRAYKLKEFFLKVIWQEPQHFDCYGGHLDICDYISHLGKEIKSILDRLEHPQDDVERKSKTPQTIEEKEYGTYDEYLRWRNSV